MISFEMDTKIKTIDRASLTEAAEIIRGGGLVAFPTETVYGLGANALDDQAVKAIFKAKGRPNDNPLIVHVHPEYYINSLVEVEYGYVYDLIKAFTPGPLTLVFKSKGRVAPSVSCGLDSLAVRIPADKNAQQFLKAVDLPIAAPSANASKHISPVTALHVYEDLLGRIPLILDGGRCEGGIESTVLDVTTETPLILRSGLITCDMIKSIVGRCEYAQHKEGDKIKSPGVKYKHYSPNCKTALFDRLDWQSAASEYDNAIASGLKPVILCDDEVGKGLLDRTVISLGCTSAEFARNVYNALHEAEKQYDYIIAIGVSGDSQVDVGVMNRLSKACK